MPSLRERLSWARSGPHGQNGGRMVEELRRRLVTWQDNSPAAPRYSNPHDPQLVRGWKGEASPEETVLKELMGELLGSAI